MTTREKIEEVIKNVPENQIDTLYEAIKGVLKVLQEAEDDAYCMALAEQAKKENDGTTYSMDEVLKFG